MKKQESEGSKLHLSTKFQD